MKKLMVVPAIIIFLFSWCGLSNAMMCDKYAGMAGGSPMMENIKLLGLDEKQMGEVKAVHFRVMKEIIKKRADMQVARVELGEILGGDPVDVKAAEAKIRLIEALRGDMKIMHIKALEEVKSKLTPDQRKKFEALMPMMHCGMMGETVQACDMKGKMKKCKTWGMRGKGMADYEDDDDMFSAGPPDKDEMPAMGHQHMHHGE